MSQEETPTRQDSSCNTEPQTCVVCLLQPAAVTYTPCHHHVVCVSCDTSIVERLAYHTTQPCPICRSPVIFRIYPMVTLLVSLDSQPRPMYVHMPLNATIWDLKGEIKKRAFLPGTSFPRIAIHGNLPSDYHTLAQLQVTSSTLVECLRPPPPPIDSLLHRLTKIRQRLAFHHATTPKTSDYELNVAVCQVRESIVLEMLKTSYGYQETPAAATECQTSTQTFVTL